MSDRINTLDELLSDPMVLLVMERDRVRPEQVRLLLERARRPAGDAVPPRACGGQKLHAAMARQVMTRLSLLLQGEKGETYLTT